MSLRDECKIGQAAPPRLSLQRSGTHVFVEPVNRALPSQVRRGFVIAFRRRIAIETVNSAGVDIAFMGNIYLLQGRVVSRPRRCQPRIEFTVMDQNSRFDLRDVVLGRGATVERRRGRYIGSQPHGQSIRNAASVTETGCTNLA